MKRTFAALAIAVSAAITQAQAANAAIVSVNFEGNDGTLTATQSAGVVPAVNFNNLQPVDGPIANETFATNLQDSTGTLTGIGVTGGFLNNVQVGNDYYSNPSQYTNSGTTFSPTADSTLLNGYLNTANGQDGVNGVTVNLTSIPYASYSIYAYFNSDTAGRAGTVAVGATSYEFTTEGLTLAGYVQATTVGTAIDSTQPKADYAVFTGLTGATQSIVFQDPAYAGLTGFQIVSTAAPTPEPASLSLLGLGAASLLGRRRKA